MKFQDYYKTMGVPRDATAREIKRAYRKLARKYHPDVSKEPDAESEFKLIGEAYSVLKDPEKRAAYDQLGEDWKAGQDFKAPPNWDAGFEFQGGGRSGGAQFAPSDFFEALFGQDFRGRDGTTDGGASTLGGDHHAKVMIDIEDAFSGGKRQFILRVPEFDSAGRLQTEQRTIEVNIPKGVKQGQHIRLAGLGAPGVAKSGDLYLEIHFNPHRLYRPEGHDLYLELPISPWEAALGAKIRVPTLAGVVNLKIPAGSAAGKKMRLKGRGLPGTPPGDCYVVLQIALPPADSNDAIKFYEEMRDQFDFKPRAHMGV